ncbi:shufflon system plasmid conjugative transfer pilus tip adhesin PilV [Salmonella enterica]
MLGKITSSGQVKGGTVASTGRMTAGEFLQINGVATAGAGCSPNGLQGRNSAGTLLSCVNGVWASGGMNKTQVVFSSSANVYCPVGTQVTGCGYQLTSYKKNGNSPDGVYPIATAEGYTGCYLAHGGYAQATFNVWAACR